jgi:hypothetical protein
LQKFQAAPTSAAPVVFAPGDEKKPIEERQSNPAGLHHRLIIS